MYSDLTQVLTTDGVYQTRVRHAFGTTSWETATPPLHDRTVVLCVSKSSKAHLECCDKRDLMMQDSVQVWKKRLR